MNNKHLIFAVGGSRAFEEIGTVSKLYNHLVKAHADGKEYDAFDVTLKDGLVEKKIGDHTVYIMDLTLGNENGNKEEYFNHIVTENNGTNEAYVTQQMKEALVYGSVDFKDAVGFEINIKHNELVITPLNETTTT